MRIPRGLWWLLPAALCFLFTSRGWAEDSDSTESENAWNVAEPAVPADTMRFTVEEGTWMSLDIHPDGHTIVFDLLGDIYTMPFSGGKATLLSGGLPYEAQPSWSPDGKQIIFTSDRGGADNIWIMDADGSDRHAITSEDFRLLNNATWSPDGTYVVARKHFTSERSMGAGEMWMYRVSDAGSGVQLTKRKNDQQDAGEPVFSPDGRYLYWSEDMSGGSTFQYNKDPNQTIYMVRRLDMKTGEIRNLIRVSGGAVCPQPSPDGRMIAFIRRIRTKSVLSLFDIETGAIRSIWDGLNRDQQETWAIFGLYPDYDWTADGKEIVIWAQGRIWKIEVASGKVTEIPFSADIEQVVAKTVRFHPDVAGEQFDVKVIRWPQVSVDGRFAIFQAMGYLYRRDLRSGELRRLTRQSERYEFAPELSRDGKTLVYVTWNDTAGGDIRMIGADGSNERVLVSRPGHYVSASLSPDGTRLVYQRGGGDTYRGRLWDEEPGIYVADLAKPGDARLLTRHGEAPRFNRTGDRIYLLGREGDKAALFSVDLLGSDRRVHVTSERAVDFRLSPDEHWLAFEELWQTYVTPYPATPVPIEVGPKMKNLPVKRLSEDGGTYLSWSADSRTLHWSLGSEWFSAGIDDVFATKPDDSTSADSSSFTPRVDTLGWNYTTDIPRTDIYFVGARILPMYDLSVINDGVVHVKNNRIAEVGTREDVAIPEDAVVFDISGKTLLPGLIDVHAHVWSSNHGIYPQQIWGLLANLAFGVTTIHDPSNNTQMIFAAAEMQRAGMLLGPRIFSTGTILYGAEGDFKTVINKYEDAVNAVRRTAAWGAISVKSYNQPRREQRQMVIKAGLENGTMIIPEGGSSYQYNVTHVLDGHTTLEHTIPVAPLYEPELRLFSQSGIGYTPTMIVGYGGLFGENYWYQHTRVWENEHLLRFVPRWVVDPRARRREMAPEEEYYHFTLARTAADIYHRGGIVEMGAHGQLQGLGAHWETWMLQQGGLTPHEALQCATWMGARALGLDHELGSIEEGKLADLIVVDGDVLDDLRQSQNVVYVMVNGRLYDAADLTQLAPEKKPLPAGPQTEEAMDGALGHDCLGDRQ